MSRDPELPEAKPETKPSRGVAALGAIVPLFATTLCCIGVPMAASSGQPTYFIQEMGVSFYLVALAAMLSGVACAAFVALAGMGKAIPSFLAIGFAALPWVAGLAGSRYGLYQVESAIAFASPVDRATIMAAGLSEALGAHVFGAGVSMGALVGTGIGLAIAAIAQRAPNRKIAAAAIGFAALPLLGGAGYLATVYLPTAMHALVVALAAFVALALGAYGVGTDGPRHRSGALAAAAAASLALAFVAACAAGATAGIIDAFRAVANADSASKAQLLAAAAAEVAPFRTVANLGLVLGLVPVIAIAGYAAARVRPTPGRLVGGALVAMVLVVTVLLDVFAARPSASIAAGMGSPWQDVDGFSAVSIERGIEERRPHAVVALDGVRAWNAREAPVALEERALTDTFRALVTAPGPEAREAADWMAHEQYDEPEWLGTAEEDVHHEAAANGDPELVLAIDARLPATALRTVLAAANAAGAKSVRLIGASGAPLTDAEREAVDDVMPAFAPLLESRAAVLFFLEGALAEGGADQDRLLYHATLAVGQPVVLEGRAGTDARLPLAERDPGTDLGLLGARACYLALGPDAGVPDLVAAVARARELYTLDTIVVLGEIPGHPERPFVEAGYLGTLGTLGTLGALGENGDDENAVREALEALMGDQIGESFGFGAVDPRGLGHGTPDESMGETTSPRAPSNARVNDSAADTQVRGSLNRDVIRRVMRRHIQEVRYCYERELVANPSLNGRVTVSFVISATGEVASARVAESTLGSAAAEACIVAAVRRFTFPAPEGGGVVAVSYPFVLTTGV